MSEVRLATGLLSGAVALETRPDSKDLTLRLSAVSRASWHGPLPTLQPPIYFPTPRASLVQVLLSRAPPFRMSVGQIPSVI